MRGGKREGAGRPQGVPNKNTQLIRDAFQKLIENNTNKFESWLEEIAKEDAGKAFDIVIKLGEYVTPKLSRQEIKDTTSLEEFINMTPAERVQKMADIKKQMENE